MQRAQLAQHRSKHGATMPMLNPSLLSPRYNTHTSSLNADTENEGHGSPSSSQPALHLHTSASLLEEDALSSADLFDPKSF